jgi:putative inorganic carbon (hco3(-)) transporter
MSPVAATGQTPSRTQTRATWRLVLLAVAVAIGATVAAQPVLGFLALSVAAFGLVVLTRPEWATIAAAAILYSNAAVVAHRIHGLPKPVSHAAGLLVVVALAHQLGVRRSPVLITQAFPWIAAYLVVQVIGAAASSEPFRALEAVQDFLTGGFLLYVAFVNVIRSEPVLRRVVWTLLIVGAVLGMLSLHQSVTENFEQNYGGFAQIKDESLERRAIRMDDEDPDPRLAGPIGEKNYYAQIMFVLVPLGLLSLAAGPRRSRRVLIFGATVFILIGGALTVSRGGAVGLALAFLILVILRILPLRYLIVLVVGVAVLLSASPRYMERLSTLGSVGDLTGGSTDDVDSATLGRLGANMAAMRVFADHPLVGVGPGMFNTYYREEAIEAGILVAEGPRAAHNFYLQILAETGMLGAIAIFGAVGATLRDLMQARRRLRAARPDLAALLGGLVAAIVTYLTTGIFLSLAYERYFWFLLALGAAGAVIAMQVPAVNVSVGSHPRPAVPAGDPVLGRGAS